MKDTPPEVNAYLFQRMMEKTPGERCLMGLAMTNAARMLVWGSLPEGLTGRERRAAFYERFYGEPLPEGVR